MTSKIKYKLAKNLKYYLSIILLILLIVSLGACKQEKIGAEIEQTGNIQENGKVYDSQLRDVFISSVYEFCNDVAWITYKTNPDDEETVIALINSKGENLYSQKEARFIDTDDSGCAILRDETTYVYSLINEKGQVVCESDGETFDRMLAFGDENILVYKFSGPKESKHLYAAIDFDGKLIGEYFEVDYDAYLATYKRCGIFHIGDDLHGCILNPDSKKVLWLEGRSPSEFVDNQGYVGGVYYSEHWVDKELNCSIGPETMLSDVEEEKFNNKINYTYYSGFMTTIEKDGKLYVRDMKANSVFEITGYKNCDLLVSFSEDTEYGMLSILTEGRNYFTVIDRKGNEQFEAIQCGENISMGNGYIAYEGLSENAYTIIDYKGNVMTENLVYESIGKFSKSGVVWVQTQDEYYHCIDIYGKQIF